MSDCHIYVSVHPLTQEHLLEQINWTLVDEEDGLIEDNHGNGAYLGETADGHIELYVDDGTDVSDILERVPFHLTTPEEAADEA